jgi:hypothetical protein
VDAKLELAGLENAETLLADNQVRQVTRSDGLARQIGSIDLFHWVVNLHAL